MKESLLSSIPKVDENEVGPSVTEFLMDLSRSQRISVAQNLKQTEMFVGGEQDDPFVELEEMDKRDVFENIERTIYDNPMETMVRVQPLAIDNDLFRFQLPILRENVIRPNMIWGAVKDLVGKDLTQVSLPVFINEPLTTLQKTAEMMVFCD